MKQQILTTAALMIAVIAMVSVLQAQEIVQTVPFKDCEMTRLGCLDKKPFPIATVPDLQIGLQLQLTCEATDTKGKDYLIKVKQIKNISVNDGSIVNYYLTGGNHGLLQYSVHKLNSTLVESTIASGYFFNSRAVQSLQVDNQFVKVSAYGTRSTRIGHYVDQVEMVFSDISINNVANSIVPKLQIFSVVDKSVHYNDLKDTKDETTVEIEFEKSTCAYN